MKGLLSIFLAFILLNLTFTTADAANYANWNAVVDDMQEVLEGSIETYKTGNLKKARDEVNKAYFGFYEKIGFERTVQAHISGNRAAQVEYQFADAKKKILNDAGEAEVSASINTLITLLREDAITLDGPQEAGASESKDSSFTIFMAAFLIMLREGFEAILIVGAIIAYLVKTGNGKQLKPVYNGSILAIFASFAMAWALNALAGETSGQNQEIIEGCTMFVAVLVLFYVSNFMMGKADAAAWQGYIQGKVNTSIAKGSMFALAFTAFLAVFREGAEVILFYQALLIGTEHSTSVWYGFGVGCFVLIFVYLAIRFLSIKLPLKPFFVGTSLLMYIMCVSFIGNGVKELQEGDVISVTLISGVPTVDILGIYPTVETIVPQLIMLALCLFTIIYAVKGWGKQRAKLEQQTKSQEK